MGGKNGRGVWYPLEKFVKNVVMINAMHYFFPTKNQLEEEDNYFDDNFVTSFTEFQENI